MKVGVGVAGNQSMVEVDVTVWVGVSVGGRGGVGNNRSHPEINKAIPRMKIRILTLICVGF
jgi:serine acetyltransferase